ncbi:hypothetical protein M3Y96_00761400 [Aphelenchoides besseyi]|nr:hypothetical protein M3Y96_00761400 [Aphelenchoides besseyi]
MIFVKVLTVTLVFDLVAHIDAHPEWFPMEQALQQINDGLRTVMSHSSSPQSFSPGYQPPQTVQPVQTAELRTPTVVRPSPAAQGVQQEPMVRPISHTSLLGDGIGAFSMPTMPPLPTFPPMMDLFTTLKPPTEPSTPAASTAVKTSQYGGHYDGPVVNNVNREQSVQNFWFKEGTPVLPTSTSLAAKALYAIANDIKSPSLTELQMLFGFDGKNRNGFIDDNFTAHKHEYKRNRKSAGDRKPRQAYSALQLETLENEFANKMEERNDKLVKGILSTNSHQQFYITTAAD